MLYALKCLMPSIALLKYFSGSGLKGLAMLQTISIVLKYPIIIDIMTFIRHLILLIAPIPAFHFCTTPVLIEFYLPASLLLPSPSIQQLYIHIISVAHAYFHFYLFQLFCPFQQPIY